MPVEETSSSSDLWNELKIHFQVDPGTHGNNILHGVIDITPKNAYRLIEKLILNYNGIRESTFSCEFPRTQISVCGLRPCDQKARVYIEAIPKNEAFGEKSSNKCSFSTMYRTVSLTPIIEFDWLNSTPGSKDKKADVIVKWFHISGQIVHEYALCLDGKEIQYMRPSQYTDTYVVRIPNFESDEKHTIQILAKLANDKIVNKSECITFIVPKQDDIPIHQDLQVVAKPDQSNGSRDRVKSTSKDSDTYRSPPKKEEKPHSEKVAMSCSCCDVPHDSFPGIDHYLNPSKNNLTRKHKEMDSSRSKIEGDSEKKKSHDDDDDVVVGS